MDELLDQLLMLSMGGNGHTQAHLFLQDCGIAKPLDGKTAVIKAKRKRGDVRCFIPPKDEDRVLMFADNSGVYVHSDGLVTIMGKDISNEIDQWIEVS